MYAMETKQHFPRSFVCTLLSAAVFGAALIAGVLVAAWPVWIHVVGTMTDPYEGCAFAVDWVVRAAQLCTPTLGALALVWIAAYVQFERLLLCGIFAFRGFGCGTALRMALGTAMPTLACAAAFHALITILFLFLIFHIRTENTIRPLGDSVTALLITGGASSVAVIAATLLLRY